MSFSLTPLMGGFDLLLRSTLQAGILIVLIFALRLLLARRLQGARALCALVRSAGAPGPAVDTSQPPEPLRAPAGLRTDSWSGRVPGHACLGWTALARIIRQGGIAHDCRQPQAPLAGQGSDSASRWASLDIKQAFYLTWPGGHRRPRDILAGSQLHIPEGHPPRTAYH